MTRHDDWSEQPEGGYVASAPVEKVEMIPGDPENKESETPAIGWMSLGGLSVCLTRSTHDGKLLIALESEQQTPVEVRVEAMSATYGDGPLWEGVIT